ncbi:MAG: hypothetical protein DSZ05_03355 [Sulfurospirillum sp.]|nr:MAG: hypothetical protein DSZ05_03355 [Sulfurospirillum sp.]
MDILEIIGKITLCLALAAALGFFIGWFFAKIRKEEKALQKYNKLLETYEIKENEIKQLHEELEMKDDMMRQMEQQYQNCERERLNNKLDEKDCDKYQKIIEELRAENGMLIAQIKEQKICEDENQILRDELQTLEEEKEHLLTQMQECKEYKENYKSLILEIESLKSEKEKMSHIEQNVEEENEKTRLFESRESSKIDPNTYLQIKQNLMTLKEEASKIRKERDQYNEALEKLRKKYDQKKKELKECRSKISQSASDSTQNTTWHMTDIGAEINDLSDNIEIKTLTQLIKDTLDDIKK